MPHFGVGFVATAPGYVLQLMSSGMEAEFFFGSNLFLHGGFAQAKKNGSETARTNVH